jgi:transglutaminase/protease-like cytokinesis protein 3
MIKLKLTITLFIFSIYYSVAQDFKKADEIVDGYPHSFSKVDKLAESINKDFSTDKEKARAIYRWVAQNVKYDVSAYYSKQKVISYSYSTLEEKERKERELEKDLANQTLKKKKAVCEGYSTLFKILCDLTGLECVIVRGYSKTMERDIGKTPKISDHAWNAVKINNKWELVDVTWGAGNVNYAKKAFVADYTDVYFMCLPERFYLKHYPEDKKWLFVDKTLKDFIELPLFYTNIALTDIEIIKPQKGIINIKGKDKIEFKWKSTIELKELSYAFSGDKYAKELSVSDKGGVLSFEIPIKKVNSEFLTFYYKGSGFLSYKLEKN